MFVAVFLHFRSVEHIRLRRRYGEETAIRIGKIYGLVSGWMEFAFLLGLWVSPQPKFMIPIFSDLSIPIAGFPVPVLHLVISLPLVLFGAWIAIRGVAAVGFDVAETHRAPKRLATKGVYGIVRHPQYLGWILSHLGVSFLLSVLYSMLFTPVLIVLIYLISRKEEDELVKEFGREYEKYRKKVPMLTPKFSGDFWERSK
ncbi:MAG: isoprenylcysteine carboxylmethyltransferase family protein [Candidatus Bathyarchaeota archaeon]|nr:isoprenylcysteine carboxylmethyltransferase family protein [Candidatus Bathyarchaeota archaeon]MDH5686687.1 isoprenylcysteine carboxylmethyltransferase family protein [Candidatus Bathyarchaeota archaeon]